MFENHFHSRNQRHPLTSLMLLLLVVVMGFLIVGPAVGFIFALPFYSGTLVELADQLPRAANYPELKLPLYIIQGFATAVGLILAPIWFMTTEGRSASNFFRGRILEPVPVLLTGFVVVIFMAVNSVFIEWNSEVNFPEFAKGFEEWARAREDDAAQLTKFLTNFDSGLFLVVAIVVVAILPAIGEEIVFRGLIQNQLSQATKNPHVAIWIAAALFSAIHFQFFGFVPRLLLGALFGYLYYWSGNLSLAIIAHFVNNGFSVLAMYFYQKGTLEYDVESVEAVPFNVVMFSAVVTIAALYYFYKYFENRKPSPDYL